MADHAVEKPGANDPASKTTKLPTKFIVAVHGIGDQTEYATIKTAAYRFFSYRNEPGLISVGGFHTKQLNDSSAPSLVAPVISGQVTLRFAEAYWAPVPRKMVTDGYELEEATHWAQTVVERFRARYERKRRAAQSPKDDLTKGDFSRIKRVLLEMIESIHILGRLMTLAEKAGLFKFNLRKLLDDYLGDVQVVADFQAPRSEILCRFSKVMRDINNACPDAEIYIIAHSEGTVVSFLGLLTALCNGGSDAGWVRQVRGYMTIGSPLDKHLLLWPELFAPFEAPKDDPARAAELPGKRVKPNEPIRWENYYDFGDPIGFSLGKIRTWLKKHQWETAFKLEEGNDHEFGRYWLPGKAHNDYWLDKQVFGHFIRNVVGILPATADGKTPDNFNEAPKSKPWARAFSYISPYFFFAVLSFAAIFVLRKGLIECVNPGADTGPALDVFKSVGLSALALCGFTAMAGVFRLTRTWRWRFIGAGIFVFLTIPYWLWKWPPLLGQPYIDDLVKFINKSLGGATHLDSAAPIFPVLIVIISMLLAVVANRIGWKYPFLGLKPLIALIGAPAATLIAITVHNQPDRGSLWPLLLSGAGAIYLWWLAALLFDLVFIWHYYVRYEAAIESLREPV